MLQWVGAGCPDAVWETISYKTTCQALQNRGLATVSRKGGQRSVVLTSAGQHYLAHGTYPPCGALLSHGCDVDSGCDRKSGVPTRKAGSRTG